jgi:quinol monooxygenase YgiN
MAIILPELPMPTPEETSPYCVIARHRALPGKADEYEQRMLLDLKNTRAEAGALQFHIHRNRFDPNLFVIYEAWRSIDALRAHFESSYVRQFVVDSAQYINGNIQAEWLIMSSPYDSGRRL